MDWEWSSNCISSQWSCDWFGLQLLQDVGDGCWRRNVLGTTLRCWWQFWPLSSPTFSIFKSTRKFKRCHRYRNAFTENRKLSPAKSHQHPFVANPCSPRCYILDVRHPTLMTATMSPEQLEPDLYPAMLILYSLCIYPLHMICDELQKISAHQVNYQIFPFLSLVMCRGH